MSNIMIVEDDFRLRHDMAEFLTQQGENVTAAANYREAMQMILNHADVDLYIVDVMLPDGDGFMLCEKIRERDMSPLIFLTACSDEASIVKGLNIGADDYVTKPFRIQELLSRIQANLRRQNIWKENGFASGDLQINREAELVYRAGKRLKLTKIEYSLLLYMMEHSGKVLSREQIISHVWSQDEDGIENNTLSVVMSRLRRKIGECQNQPYWEVVWGVGYRYLLPVRTIRTLEE